MLGKTFLIVLVLAFSFVQISAQNSKPAKYVRILNNYGAIPFEDGKTIISEIKFSGFDSEYEQYDETIGRVISEEDFLNYLRENRATINPDDLFYGYKVSKAAKLLREWLADYGYPKAETVALGELLPKNRMRLIFEIKRGLMIRVSEIRFDGNINITDEEYLSNFKQCSGKHWKIFERQKYKYFAQKCSLDLMRSKGYIQGEILSILPEMKNNYLVVKINLKEGVRYRIGEINFEGIKVFTKKELLEMLDIKSGDIVDAPKIRDFLYEKLKRIYEDRGYILFDGEFDHEFIEPQVEGLEGIVNFDITIDEGSQFKIGKIEFVGIPKIKISQDDDTDLKDLFPLKEKEIFNRTKLEEGIKKLNESGKFYPIGVDKDVEIRTRIQLPKTELVIGSNESRPIMKVNTEDSETSTNDFSPEVEIIVRVIKIEE